MGNKAENATSKERVLLDDLAIRRPEYPSVDTLPGGPVSTCFILKQIG